MTTTALDLEQLADLVDSGERQQLRMLLNDQYPADLAEFLVGMDKTRRLTCFRLLDLDNASAVLAELEPDHQINLLRDLQNTGVVSIISNMSPDDAADLLSELPTEEANSIINQMTDDEVAEELQELMSFREDSAGGIMSTDYLAVGVNMTAEQALAHLRETYKKEAEEIYDLFVINDDEHLVGWLSVKDLLTSAPGSTVATLMDTAVIQVTVDTDQEEAAEKIQKYDLLSLPVVDAEGKLRGIITADDAIDVLEEEATEDIYQTSGIDVTATETGDNLAANVPGAFRARIPWLIVTLLIESGSAMVITHFDEVIKQTVIAASFMPLLTSLTGSVAMQSTCITIRGSSRRPTFKEAVRNVWHEMRVGAMLGLSCGLLTYALSFLFKEQAHTLGLVVGASLFITMSIGVVIGTLIPLIFERMGIEPAHASGPLITSLLDVSTMTIYLSIVHAFLLHIL